MQKYYENPNGRVTEVGKGWDEEREETEGGGMGVEAGHFALVDRGLSVQKEACVKGVTVGGWLLWELYLVKKGWSLVYGTVVGAPGRKGPDRERSRVPC